MPDMFELKPNAEAFHLQDKPRIDWAIAFFGKNFFSPTFPAQYTYSRLRACRTHYFTQRRQQLFGSSYAY